MYLFCFFLTAPVCDERKAVDIKKRKNMTFFVRYIVTKHFGEIIVQFKVFTTDCDDAKWK